MLQLTMIRWRYEQNFLWTSECVVFLLLEPPSYTKLNVNASVMYLHWNACFKTDKRLMQTTCTLCIHCKASHSTAVYILFC